mmetsp:Transcript_1005/g.1414  ORF Transcript_1005/g.1414 Transcript_1005/m.1414 type:complete len:240 (+) Transcript_1005:532-1251(+)
MMKNRCCCQIFIIRWHWQSFIMNNSQTNRPTLQKFFSLLLTNCCKMLSLCFQWFYQNFLPKLEFKTLQVHTTNTLRHPNLIPLHLIISQSCMLNATHCYGNPKKLNNFYPKILHMWSRGSVTMMMRLPMHLQFFKSSLTQNQTKTNCFNRSMNLSTLTTSNHYHETSCNNQLFNMVSIQKCFSINNNNNNKRIMHQQTMLFYFFFILLCHGHKQLMHHIINKMMITLIKIKQVKKKSLW